MRVERILGLLLALVTLALARPETHTRIDRAQFQTAITRFQKGPTTVDLVGVVHIGEADYYARLNRHLGHYPQVLYELIAQPPGDLNRQELYDLVGLEAPPSNPIPRAGDNSTDTTRFQRQLCEKLGLSFQLDQIDYRGNHFLHADLTPRQLEKLLRGQPAAPKDFFERILADFEGSPAERLEWTARFMAPTNPENQKRLRQLMAQLLCAPEEFDRSLRGPESKIYIQKRNARAVTVLRQQLAKGQRKVAIFYGAAHMPDLAQRLRQELGFRQVARSWMRAWNL